MARQHSALALAAAAACAVALAASLLPSAAATATPPFRVLALGDSITQGSVPRENDNHPYTLKLKAILEQKLGGAGATRRAVEVVNGGVGGSGIFMPGFHNPTTLIPWAKQLLANSTAKFDVVIVMAGINDLLRGGHQAEPILDGLRTLYGLALAEGSDVVAVPPLPAPGFVARDDYKEGQRKRLAQLIVDGADEWNASRPRGPRVHALDLGSGPLDFYAMPEKQREGWLDDGLHLTELGYDRLGSLIAAELLEHYGAAAAPAPARRLLRSGAAAR